MPQSSDLFLPGHAKLKAQLDQRFDLRSRFVSYHSAVTADYWRSRAGREQPSDASERLRTLYEVATSLHRLVRHWTEEVSFVPGDENDPQSFWDLAEPQQEMTTEVMIDLLQNHRFECGPVRHVPGLISIYVNIITDQRFLKTPQVFLQLL